MKHYRHRLAIQRFTQTLNAYGEPVESWSVLSTVWGLVKTANRTEVNESGATRSKQAYEIEMWYRDITPKDRLAWNGLTLEILTIENIDGRNKKLRLTCEVTE